MGHYWSEMASEAEIRARNAEEREMRSWLDAGYRHRSMYVGRALVCPHAGCIVEEQEWRKHEAFHQALLEAVPQSGKDHT